LSDEFTELVSDFSRFYILTILYEGPAHGYKIINYFKKRVGKEISPSLVYPFLQKLEEKGLLKYTILCIGLFKRFAKLISITIEPSLNTCAHCGCKVYEGGYREIINGLETTFCCIHCSHSYKETQKK